MNTPLLRAVLVDVSALLLFLLIGDRLQRQFGRNVVDFSALADAALFMLFYAGFLIGVYLLRRLRAGAATLLDLSRNRLALIAIPFAVVVTLIIGDLTSFLDTIFDVNFGDTGNGYYFLVTPAIYLFFALLYFLILIQPVERPLHGQRYATAALIGVDSFAVALTAYLSAVLPRLLPTVDGALQTAVLFGLLLLLLLFPRWLYANYAAQPLLILPYIFMLFLLAALAFR